MTIGAVFDADLAGRLLDAALRTAGLDAVRGDLIRLGEHGVFRLSGGLVARVGRGPEHLEAAQLELDVSRWLGEHQVPTVRAAAGIAHPVVVDGHPVTFWHEIPGPLQRGTVTELARILRQVHNLPAATAFALDDLEPFDRLSDRIEGAPIADDVRRGLRAVLSDLESRWTDVQSAFPYGPLHGDAHTSNLVRGHGGQLALLDLETFCTGPREWDLTLTATYATSLGWVSAADYRAFVATYGSDVTESPSWPILRRVRELRMTAWLAQKAAESTAVADELVHRVRCLEDDSLPRNWSRN